MPSDDRVEHFLVDGVAPPVIGGGPPESPFDLEPDPEPRHAQADRSAQPGPNYGGGPPQPGYVPPGTATSGPPYGQPVGRSPGQMPSYGPAGHYPPVDREPPTSPIPVIDALPPEPEKRKSWVSKVFRLPGS